MSVYEQIINLLVRHHIPYQLHEHEPVRTVAEVKAKLPFLLDKMLKTVAFRVKDGRYLLPLKDKIRHAETLSAGDNITIQLTIRL